MFFSFAQKQCLHQRSCFQNEAHGKLRSKMMAAKKKVCRRREIFVRISEFQDFLSAHLVTENPLIVVGWVSVLFLNSEIGDFSHNQGNRQQVSLKILVA